ncbi:hypothetical protein TspCOW1_21530 [Thiohalobacter sp. COW1]|uniref:hypothetical protein n=1 Tax=Thiohalobacter sp. COW1 TaxID=2795687 RepID=UPI001915F78A|nr:hypothetical protein [Thiohalobacter sp. COW1]BCO32050.1 hypothetical protein TspCOW1_21530 [Thiohalobacter sp. COW1]
MMTKNWINHEAAVMHCAAQALITASGTIPLGGIQRVINDDEYRARMIDRIDPDRASAATRSAIRYWTDEYPRMSDLVRSAITTTAISGAAA